MLLALNRPLFMASSEITLLTEINTAANNRYTMMTAQKITIVIYSFFVPPGVLPSDKTKQVSRVPR